ncbi:MAG: DUF2461 domain-containing protein [Lishizhenia sp.]
MQYFTPDFLQFFIDLAPNNHKDWFDENRQRYHKSVKEPFKSFVERMIELVLEEEKNWGELEAKNCIFRINRDVRFSKDKTPYKMKVSAAIVDGGKKNHTTPGLYFELGPEDIRIYGGVYQLEKEQLLAVREAIADNLEEFNSAVNNPIFKKVYGEIHGDKNKIIPKHLKAAAEKEPLIFNKNWYYFAKFEPETLLKEDFDSFVLDIYKAGNAVKSFFEKHLK